MSTLKELEQKYNSFKNHVMYLKINDVELKSVHLYYHMIEVTATTGFEASICRINVEDATAEYKENKLSLNTKVFEIFKIGAKLEVYFGYEKNAEAKLVFSGYITTVTFDLLGDYEVIYRIEGMDVKVFMMSNIRSELKKDKKKYSDAVTAVLSGYGSLYSSKKVDATLEIKTPIEQYNQSDYDFVVNIARKLGYLFFVDRGKVNFIKYKTASVKCLTVSPGLGLKSLSKEVTITNQVKSVVVRSHDVENIKAPIEGISKPPDAVGSGSKASWDVSTHISDEMKLTIIDNSVRSVSEAETRATAELLRQSMSLVNGQIEMVGIPEVFAGGMIEIKEISEEVNGEYLITEVVHYQNEEAYTTTCKFGANKI